MAIMGDDDDDDDKNSSSSTYGVCAYFHLPLVFPWEYASFNPESPQQVYSVYTSVCMSVCTPYRKYSYPVRSIRIGL